MLDLRRSLVCFVLVLAGCDPSLGDVGGPLTRLDAGGGGDGGGASTGLVVTAEPSAPLQQVPRVLRLHASFASWTFDPTQMVLVEGSLSERLVHEIATNDVSMELAKRLVPVLTWSEGAGEALAPTAPLEPGAVYTVVMGDLPAALQIMVAVEDASPLLTRVWPPAGGSGTAALGIWCGDAGVPDIDTALVLEPSGATGRLRRGVAGAGASCLRYDATTRAAPATPSVPPPCVVGAGSPPALLRLDPRPLQLDATATAPASASCTGGEIRFGPGCAHVLDDRIVARSAPVAALWAVGGSGLDVVLAATPNEPFVITGLAPSSLVTLDVAAIDAAGRTMRVPFTATTRSPAPHVVINEVLAWPLGPSPASEWVELVNDGTAPADLTGYTLVVGSATTALPGGSLPPGGFALVVNSSYVANNGVDVAPPASAMLLRVAHLGHEDLSNEGESFSLLDSTSTPISSFPPTPKPKEGFSVARTTPDAPDALASSFALTTPTPGRPNTF